MSPDIEAAPDDFALRVRCRQCSRFWFYLSGTVEHGLRRVTGYPTLLYRMDESGNVTADYRPGSSSVRVNNMVGPLRGDTVEVMGTVFPRLARERFRVTCHRRCGRPDTTLTKETLAHVFSDAASAGRADIEL